MSPSFSKGPTPAAFAAFGKNQYLRDTDIFITESFTVAASSVATETINGVAQKVLQSGEILAKITTEAGTSTADDIGKVGPYDVNATDGRQTLTNIVGINDTFLPWQLMEHDETVAVVVACRAYQARCFERVTGVRGALGNTTAAGLVAKKTLNVLFA